MPSVAVCPNADIPVDLLKTLEGFENELEGAKFLIKRYLATATGRLNAGAKLAEVEAAVREAKTDCVNDHFGG